MTGTTDAPDFGDRPSIVVGVDGSDPSKDALRWAAGQARLTGADLRAVSAWDLPTGYGFAPDYSYGDMAARALEELKTTVTQVLGEAPDVPVVVRVERGHAARVLVDACREADLLVVGSRGRGAFAGTLLGSVSRHCAEYADCPVVIVRARPRSGAREEPEREAREQAAQEETRGHEPQSQGPAEREDASRAAA